MVLDDCVAVGEIAGSQGRVGEVRVNPLTDFPERFRPGLRLLIAPAGGPLQEETLEVVHAWERPPFVVIKFAGVDSIDAADKLRGHVLYVPADEVHPLPEGSFYVFQLIGLEVVGVDGEGIGQVTEVITGPANDVYVVEAGLSGTTAKRHLIPATKEIVKVIDLDARRMVISPIPGLLE